MIHIIIMVIIINVNDMVGRLSYKKDIVFRIKSIIGNQAILQGVYVRLYATAFLDDLELISTEEIKRLDEVENKYYNEVVKTSKNSPRHVTGKILHIDGDANYLKKCLKLYNDLDIYAYGIFLEEKEISINILELIENVNPDVVVLTGHDSFNNLDKKDLNNYTNTAMFMKTIKEIRKKFSKDHIFIFAGACQSNFEALMAAGANYASSPNRINIDAYDPAIVAIKAATTPFNDIIYLNKNNTNGTISGVESYGKMRLLL